MARAPVGQQAQRARQLLPARRELVHEALGPVAVGLGEHEALALEPPEPLGEHVRRDSWELLLKVTEAPWPVEERLDEQQRPAVAHALQGCREGCGRWSLTAEILAVYSDLQFASNWSGSWK